MLRRTFLWLSEQPEVFAFLKRNRAGRSVASRFVAGETIESAIAVARELNTRGISVSLDLLGESVSNEAEAAGARDEVVATLDAIAAAGVEGNVSVKLTQLGLDIDRALCRQNMQTVLARAQALGIFVRMDMESSDYTARTLALFLDDLEPEYHDLTGVVIQSYLRRSSDDIESLIGRRARVRLCKGAYAEPDTVAFQEKADVDGAFVRLMERLLTDGNYPAIATHDERLIDRAVAFVREHGIPPERFEFQMLYGVRRDLQDALRADGFNVRVYVPFGTAWYPYLMRRLAERPANVAFMAGSVMRELVSAR
jgi:proline dehydrogenase